MTLDQVISQLLKSGWTWTQITAQLARTVKTMRKDVTAEQVARALAEDSCIKV